MTEQHTIYFGEKLKALIEPAKKFKKRYAFKELQKQIYHSDAWLVPVLYGLKGTGKTTLMYQAILEMSDEDFNQTIFIKTNPHSSQYFSSLLCDLWHTYKYIFIDDITSHEDFVNDPNFGEHPCKIIVAGDEIHCFNLSRYDLFKYIPLHFMSYKEYKYLLNGSFDQYIKYGGLFYQECHPEKYIEQNIIQNFIQATLLYNDYSIYHFFTKRYLTHDLKPLIKDYLYHSKRNNNYCEPIYNDLAYHIDRLHLDIISRSYINGHLFFNKIYKSPFLNTFINKPTRKQALIDLLYLNVYHTFPKVSSEFLKFQLQNISYDLLYYDQFSKVVYLFNISDNDQIIEIKENALVHNYLKRHYCTDDFRHIVLYFGKTQLVNNILYMNYEEYLLNLEYKYNIIEELIYW